MASTFAYSLLKLAAFATVLPVATTTLSSHAKPEIPVEAVSNANPVDATPDAVELEHPDRQVVASPDGLFYLDATSDGKKVKLLVDSGANATVLTQSDARRLGLRPERLRFAKSLVTANGTASLAITRIAHLTIAGKSYRDVQVGVVKGEGGVSLLGQDMIRRLHGISIDDGVLTIAEG